MISLSVPPPPPPRRPPASFDFSDLHRASGPIIWGGQRVCLPPEPPVRQGFAAALSPRSRHPSGSLFVLRSISRCPLRFRHALATSLGVCSCSVRFPAVRCAFATLSPPLWESVRAPFDFPLSATLSPPLWESVCAPFDFPLSAPLSPRSHHLSGSLFVLRSISRNPLRFRHESK